MKKIATAAVCSVLAIIGIVNREQPALRTDDAGLKLIANAEGCRRDPYHCSAHKLTVGIGSTSKVNASKHYSDKEIADRFIADVRNAENCVNSYANGKNMTQGQFNAVTSFVFNVGCRKKSTLFRYARAGKWSQMCDELPKWSYVNGRKSKAILKRRLKEKAMCYAKSTQ